MAAIEPVIEDFALTTNGKVLPMNTFHFRAEPSAAKLEA